MTTLFRLRLAALILAIVLVAGLTLWGVQSSWRRIHALEHKLTSGHFENFRLADDFQKRLLKLDNAMMTYANQRDPATRREFDQASAELDVWIDQYDTRLNKGAQLATDAERKLFVELNDAFALYLGAAKAVPTNAQPALRPEQISAPLDEFKHQAEHLQNLGQELAAAHRAAEESFLDEANRALSNLRVLLLVGVALLLALVGALGLLLYRDQIAPLRTRLVQSQAVLEKQEKLATLGTLAAGIAHEIRNPLTSVKARLYTLDRHLDSPQLARKDAEVISGEISRLEGIVQDVLDFARPSDPELRPVHAQTLLREVHSLMSSSLERQGVQLQMEAGPDLVVAADDAHLKQVLINLVRNAADAIEGKGSITLRTRAEKRKWNGREAEAIILEVIDTGRGIPPEVEKRLFDPFFSTKETGTGLGLSIAARIVEKHGGTLQYQSRVGHGTTFGIVLPLAAVIPAVPEVARAPA